MNLEIFNKMFEAPPLQHRDEYRNFLEICESHLKEHKIANPVVVELGIWRGYQRQYYEQFLGATYIGIDRSKKRCRPDIQGDTHNPKTLERLKERLAGKAINILFIDASHDYEDVKKDFEMYSPLCTDIIALHDLSYDPVKKFWAELKEQHNDPEPIAGKCNFRYDCRFILIEHFNGIGMMIKR